MDADDQRVLNTLAAFYDNLHDELCSKGGFCSAHQPAAGIITRIRREIGQEITDEINADPVEVARLRAAQQGAWAGRRVPLQAAFNVDLYEDDEHVEEVRAAFERAVKHLTAPPPRLESPVLGAWRERHDAEVRRIADQLVTDHAAILERLHEEWAQV